MYPPSHFQEHDVSKLQRLIKKFPLATILIPNKQNELNDFCYIPLIYNQSDNRFIGHVAKHNPLARGFLNQVNLLFNGENCYLSPSYCDNKTLPSWLYCSVSITAKVKIVSDFKQQETIMEQLINHFEQDFIPPWSLNHVAKQNREAMYAQLTFLEFLPIHWQGNFKLSQNKPAAVREAIKQSLKAKNKADLVTLFE